MNKICGYNCEHNKGGQCQITYCDKIGKITTTTQWLSGGRQQGKTYQLIKDQQKEIERLNNIINQLKEDIEFCLKSIKQEYEMSTDERTRIEMESCKQILEEKLKTLKEGK